MSWDTLGRSRDSTVVVTANGEVQTKEEAQEKVHDLDLFVTVPLHEETPAVPSLPKKGRQFYAKRTISVNSCRSMVIHQFWKRFVFNIDIAGFVSNKSSPRAKWRTSSRKLERITPKGPQSKKERGMRDFGRPFARSSWMVGGVHRWFRTQSRNVLRKWNQNQGSTGFFTLFPNDWNCEVCFQTKMTRAHCTRRTGEAPLLAEKVWWLDNGWSQSSVNHETVTVHCRGTRSCHSQYSVSSVQKQRLHRRRKRVCESSFEPSQKPKVIYTDT